MAFLWIDPLGKLVFRFLLLGPQVSALNYHSCFNHRLQETPV
jgi:hypothetical protein